MITSDIESYNQTTDTRKRGTAMHEQFITDKSGQKISVILPIHEYDELLEDLKDLATVAELKNEPTVSLDSVIKKLKANDLL